MNCELACRYCPQLCKTQYQSQQYSVSSPDGQLCVDPKSHMGLLWIINFDNYSLHFRKYLHVAEQVRRCWTAWHWQSVITSKRLWEGEVLSQVGQATDVDRLLAGPILLNCRSELSAIDDTRGPTITSCSNCYRSVALSPPPGLLTCFQRCETTPEAKYSLLNLENTTR